VETQTDYRRLARESFPGFRIQGQGLFCVLDSNTMSGELFDSLLLANATGRHVHILKPPAPRTIFRRNKMLDDD
jgi:hypothetical protein